jgi:uncharacterized protein YciI
MKKLLCAISCLVTLHSFAQDSTRAKQKEYLGVLTLTEKYKVEKNWTPEAMAIVGEHYQRLVKMKEQGTVVIAGRTNYEVDNPDMMGLVIFYARNDAAALEFMMEDPAVKNSIMQTKVHPYGIAINKCE